MAPLFKTFVYFYFYFFFVVVVNIPVFLFFLAAASHTKVFLEGFFTGIENEGFEGAMTL